MNKHIDFIPADLDKWAINETSDPGIFKPIIRKYYEMGQDEDTIKANVLDIVKECISIVKEAIEKANHPV